MVSFCHAMQSLWVVQDNAAASPFSFFFPYGSVCLPVTKPQRAHCEWARGLPQHSESSFLASQAVEQFAHFCWIQGRIKRQIQQWSLLKSANFASSQEKKEFSWESWQWLEEMDYVRDNKLLLSEKKSLNASKSHSHLIKKRARCEQSELVVLSHVKAQPSHLQHTASLAKIMLRDTRVELPAKVWVEVLSLAHNLVLRKQLLKSLRLVVPTSQIHLYSCSLLCE